MSLEKNSLKNNIILVRSKHVNLKYFAELFNDLYDGIELINSTFTTQLIFAMLSFLITDIFAAYGALKELLVENNRLPILLVGNSVWVAIQYAIKGFMVYAGSSTTDEAEKPITIIAKAAGSMDSSELKSDLMALLVQLRCRNKKLENVFFTINWNLILAVHIFIK